MEAWFEEGLKHPYASVLERFGFPAKRTSADFLRPCRLGESLVVELFVARLGTSSMALNIRVVGGDGKPKATGEVLCVCISVASGEFQFQKTAIPPELRKAMTPFVHPTPED